MEQASGPVYAVAFHPKDNTLIATASQDKTARVWDLSDGKMKVELKGHTDRLDTTLANDLAAFNRMLTRINRPAIPAKRRGG